MNRGALKTRVGKILGMAMGSDSDSLSEIALLEELANEAVVDVLSRTRVHVRDATIVLTAGTTEYDIDDTILRILDVRGMGANQTTPSILYRGERTNLGSSDLAFAGFTRIQFGKAAGTGDSILINYVPAPTAMTTDADDPAAESFGRIPPQFHRALLNYMCWHAADKLGDAGSQRGEVYRRRYEGQQGLGDPGSDLARIKTAVNLQGGVTKIRTARPALLSDQYPSRFQG